MNQASVPIAVPVPELRGDADAAWAEVTTIQHKIESEYNRHQERIRTLMTEKQRAVNKWLPLIRKADEAKKQGARA
jgi:hypothetical protein